MATRKMRLGRRVRHVDALERVLNLFTILHRANVPLTREQIVRGMAQGMTPYPVAQDAQRQLFSSDKNTISRDLGIPVCQVVGHADEAGQTKYWIKEEEMYVPEMDLTNEEIAVISLALAAIHHSVPQAGEALMKLAGSQPSRQEMDIHVGLPLVVVRLTEAAQKNQIVRINNDGVLVDIEPNSLLFDKGTWYVIAFVGGAKKLSALKCSRIALELEILDVAASTSHRLVGDKELRRLVHNSVGEDITATVVVDDHAASISWWDKRVVENEILDNGRMRLTVTIDDPARFRGWLLGFGTHGVIEGPRHLRADFVKWLDALALVPTVFPSAPTRPVAAKMSPGPRPLGERLQRLLCILPWLAQRGSISVDELADMVGINPKYLFKDLEFASMCGLPPYTHDALFDFSVQDGLVLFHGATESSNPFRRTKTLMTRGVKLTPRQATAVGLGLASLDAISGELSVTNDAASSLRRKLALAIGDLPMQVHLEDAPLLSEIQTAVAHCREIDVVYMNGEDEILQRVLHPQLIFVERGEAYLVADDMQSGELERVFRIDRLMECQETGNNFLGRAVQWNGWKFRGEVQEAILYIAVGNEWVLDRIGTKAHVINDDGSMFLWVDVASHSWLARLLLRCGQPSCVISPVSLRTVVSERAQAIRALYS